MLISYCMYYLLVIFIFSKLTNKKMFSKNMLLALAMMILFCSLFFYLAQVNSIIIVIILVCFNYDKDKVVEDIIMALFTLIIIATSSFIMRVKIDPIMYINNSEGDLDGLIYIIIEFIIATLLLYLIKYSIKKLYKKNIRNIELKYRHITFLGGLGLIFAYLSGRISRTYLDDEASVISSIMEYDLKSFIIYMLILVILLIIVFLMTKNNEIYKSKLRELEQLQEYTASLESMSGDLRKFRHDYVNIFATILGYLNNNDIDGLKKHINKNIIPLEKRIIQNNSRLDLLKHIKIFELKGIVASKLIKAQDIGIDVYVDIMEEIKFINLDIISLCRVIGILLDNAIEEGQALERPNLRFGIVNKNQGVDIIISNKCRENIKPIYKLYSKGYSTKGENRGMGLNIVNNIVENNKNLLIDTTIKDGEFIQSLSILNGGNCH